MPGRVPGHTLKALLFEDSPPGLVGPGPGEKIPRTMALPVVAATIIGSHVARKVIGRNATRVRR